jgi:adenylate kinase
MSEKLRILFLGPAGSGKGTQSARLAEKFKLVHISTGDLIRGEIKSGSDLGNKVKAIVEAGQLVSDEIVNEIVKNKVSQLDRFILDGYPRTLEQAKFFSEFSSFEYIFDLEVPRELLMDRLTGRRMCSKTNDPQCTGMFHVSLNPPKEDGKCDLCGSDLYQRKDDMKETIEKRLNGYEDETGKPLNSFYGSKVTKVDGTKNPDEVFAELTRQLSEVVPLI